MSDYQDTYIVRVYRRGKKGSGMIVGVVEKAGAEGKTAFHEADELVGLITGRGLRKPGERRRSERLELKLPVVVKGENALGKRFTEETLLEDLSSGGACLSLKNPVTVDKRLRLVIDPERSGLKMGASVVRLKKKTGVGVRFVTSR